MEVIIKILYFILMKAEKMKIFSVVLGILFILSGCQLSGPIELVNDHDDSRFIEVISVGSDTDSVFASSGIDSAGLLGSRYYGKMLLTDIYYSLPGRSDSFLQAEAIFLDQTKPVEYNGHLLGYASFDVGTLMLEDDTIPRIQRRLRLGPLGDTLIGYHYRLRKQHTGGQGFQYHWRGFGNAGIGPFNTNVPSAPEMRILEIDPPFVPPGAPLSFRWRCMNEYVHIYISREGEQPQRAWIPMLHLRIRNINGEIELPEKVLDILPMKRYQRFLFTLTSEAQAAVVIPGYPDSVLLHSASIHNILLNVGP